MKFKSAISLLAICFALAVATGCQSPGPKRQNTNTAKSSFKTKDNNQDVEEIQNRLNQTLQDKADLLAELRDRNNNPVSDPDADLAAVNPNPNPVGEQPNSPETDAPAGSTRGENPGTALTPGPGLISPDDARRRVQQVAGGTVHGNDQLPTSGIHPMAQ